MHAFSPMEIMYGSRRTGMSYADYLGDAAEHGLGTIPGTAAEILDDEVREILSHKKVDVRDVDRHHHDRAPARHAEHRRRSCTATSRRRATSPRTSQLIRDLQNETGGFTEFVPLRFIHNNTELYRDGLVNDPPAEGPATTSACTPCTRLLLRGSIDNLQTSWVKINHELAQLSLRAGCNDFGGTLMEESISREAGADAGEYTPVEEIRRLIRGIGRRPVERTTLYQKLDAGGGEPDACECDRR